MNASPRRNRARRIVEKPQVANRPLTSADEPAAEHVVASPPASQAMKTLVVCAPNLGRPGMPVAEFGPAATSDARPTPAEVFHVMAQHASGCSAFRGVVLAPLFYNPDERQRAAVSVAHHFRFRSDAVRAVEAITWVPLPVTLSRDELAGVIEQESSQLRDQAGDAPWAIALWCPEAFGIESSTAPAFVSTAVFGDALTL